MDAVSHAWSRITAWSLPFAVVAAAAMQSPSLAGPPAGSGASTPATAVVAPADGRDLEELLQRLNALSALLGRDPQSAGAWRVELEQAEVLERLAARSEGAERDNWLRMAVDSYYSAASLSPASETEARQRLAQLPGRLAGTAPNSPAVAYAALQCVRANWLRRLTETPDNPTVARVQLCEGLLAFASAYPRSAEAPGTVLEAAQSYEELGRTDDARRCYRYLAEHFPTHAAAKYARGSLWRLAGPGTPVPLDLPPLYPTGDVTGATTPPNHPHGSKVVVAYFWSSTSPQAGTDLEKLRELSGRYQDQGLEVVSVDVDADPAQGRAFLAGKLTAGVQLYQPGGPEGAAEHYGITTLPSAMLVTGDGKLIRNSLKAAQLDAEVAKRLSDGR
jgi:tetratricopeptide (TPR) repeat protein